jgi:hypothetical protein
MRVLVACEWSGRVRDAFRDKGHDAWSCDRVPTFGKYREHFIRGDVLDYLDKDWDMMIAFPPCTYLTKATWIHRDSPGEEAALWFVRELMNADIPRIAIENPVGVISTHIRKPDQIVHPYWFGDPYQKGTCLWLKNLPLLVPQNECHPGDVTPWVSHSGMRGNTIGAGVRNAKDRGKTFRGFAQAMADQWGDLNGDI